MGDSVDSQRLLSAIATALNDAGLDGFDSGRIEEIVGRAASGRRLTVDGGGGLHAESGVRIGAIRRAPSGEWIIDRQNVDAPRSEAPIG